MVDLCGIRRQDPTHSMLMLELCLLMRQLVKACDTANPRINMEGTIKGGDIGRSDWWPISVTNGFSSEHTLSHSILTSADTVVLIFLMRKFKFREI